VASGERILSKLGREDSVNQQIVFLVAGFWPRIIDCMTDGRI